MADTDVSKISLTAPKTKGKTGKKILFKFSGLPLSELMAGLKFELEGPTKPDILLDYESKDISTLEYFFVPLVAGDYKLIIKFKDNVLIGCPFKIDITGDPISAEKLISKVKVHGKCIEIGEAFCLNEFTVDCRKVKPVIGELKVHVKCPERCSATLNIVDNRNGTHTVQYKPIAPGTYKMDIKIADEHIPGSPFDIRVHISRRKSLTINN